MDAGFRARGIDIVDDALIGRNTVTTTLSHHLDPVNRVDTHPAPTQIGRGAWLGANVTFLPGVTTGDGAVVGGGSVVMKDVTHRAVVVE